MSHLVTLSRHTVSNLIATSGRLEDDWSADYRLLSRERFEPGVLFGAVRTGVLQELAPDQPLVVALDDTISEKKGAKIPGVGWRRAPLSPPFHANLAWGRRFVQLSAIVPGEDAPSRAVPIDFVHAPAPPKPRRKDPPEQQAASRQACRLSSLARQAAARVKLLREHVDHEDVHRLLWVVADGGYTNASVLKALPERTVFIGRIRSDAQLHREPTEQENKPRGRRRCYGEACLTPEQVLTNDAPWSRTSVYAAGKVHSMRYKEVGPVLWRSAGPHHRLRLIVVAPLAYRPSARSRLLYRRPAFLICTDPDVPAEAILKAYVSRWEIEVNMRDEKQLLGFDEAQVRTPASAENAPALAVAAYAIMLLAGIRAFGLHGIPAFLPLPKWRRRQGHPKPRASTNDLQNQFRHELWARAIVPTHFSGFDARNRRHPSRQKSLPSLPAMLFTAQPRA